MDSQVDRDEALQATITRIVKECIQHDQNEKHRKNRARLVKIVLANLGVAITLAGYVGYVCFRLPVKAVEQATVVASKKAEETVKSQMGTLKQQINAFITESENHKARVYGKLAVLLEDVERRGVKINLRLVDMEQETELMAQTIREGLEQLAEDLGAARKATGAQLTEQKKQLAANAEQIASLREQTDLFKGEQGTDVLRRMSALARLFADDKEPQTILGELAANLASVQQQLHDPMTDRAIFDSIQCRELIVSQGDQSPSIKLVPAQIVTYDGKGTKLTSLGASKAGNGTLSVYNKGGSLSASVTSSTDGRGYVETMNKDGGQLTILGSTVDGDGGLYLRARVGMVRVGLPSRTTSFLSLVNATNEPLKPTPNVITVSMTGTVKLAIDKSGRVTLSYGLYSIDGSHRDDALSHAHVVAKKLGLHIRDLDIYFIKYYEFTSDPSNDPSVAASLESAGDLVTTRLVGELSKRVASSLELQADQVGVHSGRWVAGSRYLSWPQIAELAAGEGLSFEATWGRVVSRSSNRD